MAPALDSSILTQVVLLRVEWLSFCSRQMQRGGRPAVERPRISTAVPSPYGVHGLGRAVSSQPIYIGWVVPMDRSGKTQRSAAHIN